MLIPSKCSERHCKHFRGVYSPDNRESSERYVCDAFTDRIPSEITSGMNKHEKPLPGQKNKIVFEEGPFPWERGEWSSEGWAKKW